MFETRKALGGLLGYSHSRGKYPVVSMPFDEAPESETSIRTQEGEMKSPIVKRSIVIAGHKTSVSLEDAFWKGLKDIALGRDLTLSEMVGTIDAGRAQGNLSSALRLFVLDHYRAQISTATDGRTSPLSDIEQDGGKPVGLSAA
jgi:predicted DNA-binding ribbon-helix-helix protein